MPPSITYWNRIEPRPRVNSIAGSLAAPVRDPLWLVARQWQMGELSASDSGSPLFVELMGQTGTFAGWMPADQATGQAWTGAFPPPLEKVVASEPFTPDLATRVELGQWFEALLGQNVADGMIDDLRAAYPLPLLSDRGIDRMFTCAVSSTASLDTGTLPTELVAAFVAANVAFASPPAIWPVTPGSQWVLTDASSGLNYAVVTGGAGVEVFIYRDAEALRFLRICANRAPDGVRILMVALTGTPILPAHRNWTVQQVQALVAAGTALADAVQAVYGSVGIADPLAWQSDRLEFDLSVAATTGNATVDVLNATPDMQGSFDWTAFDLEAPGGSISGVSAGTVSTFTKYIAPGHVSFRGMPDPRWWEFETAQTDFGDIQPEKRDLAKLIFMDFMLIHGDDWYLIPLSVPLGSLVGIQGLLVHDVFGIVTKVDRSDAKTTGTGLSPGQQWTMFSPMRDGQPPQLGRYLVVPPTAWPTAATGPVIDEARLLKDLTADMVWGVETVVEGGSGLPWPGRERDRAGKPTQTPTNAPPDGAPPLKYALHSPVPASWIPFVPVSLGQNNGFTLQRAIMPGDVSATITPAGRILRTTSLREQTVSTEGTVISRLVCRSRWIDGSTHLWIARRRTAGLGQGNSGLRFDLAVPSANP